MIIDIVTFYCSEMSAQARLPNGQSTARLDEMDESPCLTAKLLFPALAHSGAREGLALHRIGCDDWRPESHEKCPKTELQSIFNAFLGAFPCISMHFLKRFQGRKKAPSSFVCIPTWMCLTPSTVISTQGYGTQDGHLTRPACQALRALLALHIVDHLRKATMSIAFDGN